MMKSIQLVVFTLGFVTLAEIALARTAEIPIWPGPAPGSERLTLPEGTIPMQDPEVNLKGDLVTIRNVSRPTLIPFLPPPGHGNGMAVILVPASRLVGLTLEDWTKTAEALNSRGIAAFVLKYRLIPSGSTPEEYRQRMRSVTDSNSATYNLDGGFKPEFQYIVPLATEDLRQSVRILRRDAARWNLSPDRIGVIASGYGGLLLNGLLTSYDAASRPDFAAELHGYIIEPEKVPKDAPPLFIACANDDDKVPSTNCSEMYLAWRERGRSAELHIFSVGTHLFNIVSHGTPSDHWIDRYLDWSEALKPAK